MVIAQGDIWWANLREPSGTEPGDRRPVVIVQHDAFDQSSIRTVVCVALTSDLRFATTPGNVLLRAEITRLPRDSVANITQITTVDRNELFDYVATLPKPSLAQVIAGIGVLITPS